MIVNPSLSVIVPSKSVCTETSHNPVGASVGILKFALNDVLLLTEKLLALIVEVPWENQIPSVPLPCAKCVF